MLEQKVRNDPLSERTPRRAEQLNLLTKLAAQVDPEFRPVARRGERQTATGSVDAIVGFAKISGFLRDEEVGPLVDRRANDTGNFGETIELATFGHLRNESGRALEVERRRLATYAAPGGAWEVRDVSQTGYRLIAPMTVINAVTLGTLAAIRAHGQPLWTLGIVRRMKRLTGERAEIGLQMIANNLVGVELSEYEARRGRLFGRRRIAHGQRPPLPRVVSVAAQAQRRCADPDADRAGGRISAGQAPADERRQDDAIDRLRPPAGAATRLDLGDGRIARADSSVRRSRVPEKPDARRPLPRDLRAASVAGACRLQHRFRGLPPSRQRSPVASPSIGKTRTAQRATLTYATLQQQANRLSQRAASRSGSVAATRSPSSCRNDRRRRSRTSPATRWARSRCRCRSCSAPTRSSTGCTTAEARVVIVDPASLPNLAPIRDQVRRPCATSIGVAGARESWTVDWDDLLAKASPRFAPGRHACRRSRAAGLHQRHDRPAEGRADAASVPARQPARIRLFARRVSARGDVFWSPADWAWTGGLMDALLPTLYFGCPIVGYRGRFDPERALALMAEVSRHATPSCFPTALKMMMKAVPRAARRATTLASAQHHERRRSGGDDGIRVGAATRWASPSTRCSARPR